MTLQAWDALLDEARASSRASERVRERWLGQQAQESATLVGTLVDLAEGGVRVGIRVEGGRRHEGEITALGIDVVVLRDRGEHVAVPVSAVSVVRPLPGATAGVAKGDRAAAIDVTFPEVAARLAPDRPEVAIALREGDAVAGVLLAAGLDVLTIRVAPGPEGLAYVSVSAVSSLRFRSG